VVLGSLAFRRACAALRGIIAASDELAESFLKLSTAQVQLGLLSTPCMTPLVLRHEDHEYRLNTLGRTLRAGANYTAPASRFCD